MGGLVSSGKKKAVENKAKTEAKTEASVEKEAKNSKNEDMPIVEDNEEKASEEKAVSENNEDNIVDNELPALAIEGDAPKGRGARRRIGVSAETVDVKAMKNTPSRVIGKSEEDRKHILDAVKNNFLFTSLDEDEMKTVLDAMECKKYKPGENIIKQGDDGDEFFSIEEGEAECYLDFKDGNVPKMVKHYERGESFGELALMYNTPRAASIVAKTDVKAWAMDRFTFRKVLLTSTQNKRDKWENFLAKVPLLESLDRYEMSKVADALVEEVYNDGDEIITMGDTDDHKLYILLEGSTIATKPIDNSGVPKTVMTYSVGDFFGELALLNQGTSRQANVSAVGAAKCVSIDKDSFDRLLGPCEDIMKRNKKEYEKVEKELKGEA